MAQGGIDLNPGADPTLVNAAYAAAMANVPKDLSVTFEALATNYADTMKIVGANWAEVAKTVGGWANEAGQNFIAGQKLLNKGLVIENANGVKFLYNALKNNRKEMRQTWFGGGNPWSPENAEKRLLLQQTQEKLTAQIELLDTGWDGIAGQIASGEIDETATRKNWRIVNAIGAYKSSSGKTKDGEYIVPDHDENGDIILTLYKNGEPVADEYGRNITTTPTEMENLVVLNNENRDTNINTHYTNMETSAKNSNSKASVDHFLPQFRGKIEKEVKGKNNLLGAINTKNYNFTEPFVQDYTNPGGSVAAAEVFGMMSKIKLVADDGSRLEFDEMADGKAGLTEGDFVVGAENYEKIVGALTDQTNKFFDEDVTREAYLDWAESGARKAWDYGVSQRSGGGGTTGVDGDDDTPLFTKGSWIKLGPGTWSDRDSYNEFEAQGLHTDISKGNTFKFYGNKYHYEDGNWYETELDGKKEGEPSLIGNNKELAVNVLNTNDPRFTGITTEKIVKTDMETGEVIEEKEAAPETQSTINKSFDVNMMKMDDNAVATKLQELMPTAFQEGNLKGYSFRVRARFQTSWSWEDPEYEQVALYTDDDKIVRYPKDHPTKAGEKVLIKTGGSLERRKEALKTIDDILNTFGYTKYFESEGAGGVGSTYNKPQGT